MDFPGACGFWGDECCGNGAKCAAADCSPSTQGKSSNDAAKSCCVGDVGVGDEMADGVLCWVASVEVKIDDSFLGVPVRMQRFVAFYRPAAVSCLAVVN